MIATSRKICLEWGGFVRELVQQIVQDLFIHVLKKLTLTLHPLLQAYKVGLQRFQKDYKRMVEQNNGTEVCPSLHKIPF